MEILQGCVEKQLYFCSPMSGIYIHIPFCASRCVYCDFFSSVDSSRRGEYVDAVARELALRRDELQGEPVTTVYFGGGTPSTLSSAEREKLFATLSTVVDWGACSEVTFEANPDDVTDDFVASLRDTPVNRLSMGVQSFDDSDLAFLRRRHTAQSAVEAVERCRRAGYENLSIDLIYGLPHQTLDRWNENLQRAVALRVPHLSAYNLIYEEGTALWRMREQGRVAECDDETSLRMFERLMDVLATQGYEHYEISNFALPGQYARHNTSYWRGVPYLGLGASAHSYDGRARRINPSSLSLYIETIGQGRAAFEEEVETVDSLYNERILTSLRTCWGLDMSRLESDFGEARAQYCREQARPHLQAGRMELSGDRLRITRQGIFTSDDIMSDLFWVDE